MTAEQAAVKILLTLIELFGAETIGAIAQIVTGGDTIKELIHEESIFAANVLRDVLSVLDKDRVLAIAQAGYAAADQVLAAEEKAKFG